MHDAFDALRAGKTDAGHQKLAALVADLEKVWKRDSAPGIGSLVQHTLSPGAERMIVWGQSFVIADTKTGQPVRWGSMRIHERPVFTATHAVFRAGNPKRVHAVELKTGKMVTAPNEATGTIAAGPTSVFLPLGPKGPSGDARIVRWDPARNRYRGELALQRQRVPAAFRPYAALPITDACRYEVSSCSKQLTDPAPVGRRLHAGSTLTLGPKGRVLLAHWSHGTSVWDTRARRHILSLAPGPHPFYIQPPGAFSPDGRYLAIAASGRDDKTPSGVVLVDLKRLRPVATLTGCTYPTNLVFSDDSKKLAVGDLRRACVYDVASQKLVTTTPFIRPYYGPDDDRQAIDTLRFVGRGRGVLLIAGDETLGIVNLQNNTLIFSGAGSFPTGYRQQSYRAADTTFAFASDAKHDPLLVTVHDNGAVQTRQLSKAEHAGSKPIPELVGVRTSKGLTEAIAKLTPHVCHVGGYVLPAAACVSQ